MRAHRAIVVASTIGALFVVFASRARSDELREDVFLCEDAVAHVQQCCPFNAAQVQCTFAEGCGSPATTPQLSIDTARCIIHSSCDALRAGVVCNFKSKLCP